ncbi:MAG TPA: heavy metal-binding domain-containing protein [Roseiarcus sp.]|nr:heavy metal-binding domain-containing protein [Roseiarcus sp.]
MQVSRTNKLQDGRGHYSIGRIKACAAWRAADTMGAEADRLAAVQALIREAQEYDADAIIGLDFEVDGVKSADIGGAPLQRVAATGIAVKFAEAA